MTLTTYEPVDVFIEEWDEPMLTILHDLPGAPPMHTQISLGNLGQLLSTEGSNDADRVLGLAVLEPLANLAREVLYQPWSPYSEMHRVRQREAVNVPRVQNYQQGLDLAVEAIEDEAVNAVRMDQMAQLSDYTGIIHLKRNSVWGKMLEIVDDRRGAIDMGRAELELELITPVLNRYSLAR